MSFEKYLFSLKKYIFVSLLIFILGIFYGYFSAKLYPKEAKKILLELQNKFEPVKDFSLVGQFLFIFLNNSLIAFATIILGIFFGIIPFLILFSNSTILGLVIYFAKLKLDWTKIFLLLFPHGIFEIPVIILANAIAFKLGKTFLWQILKKEKRLKKEFNLAIEFYLKFLLSFLAIAATIEVALGRFFIK